MQHERRRRRCASRGVPADVFAAGRSLFSVVLCGYADALVPRAQAARALELSWASRRSPPTINGRSRHPRAAPTRTKLLAFDRWSFPSDSQPSPRRGKVHRPSAAPSPETAASASERRVLAQIWQNEQSLGGLISDHAYGEVNNPKNGSQSKLTWRTSWRTRAAHRNAGLPGGASPGES